MPTKTTSSRAGKTVAKTSGRSAQLALERARRATPPQTSSTKSPVIQTAEPDRLVVGKDGRLVYIAENLAKTMGLMGVNFAHMAFRDVIQFVNPDDALRDRPVFGFGASDQEKDDDGDAWVSSITSGDHAIIPLLNKKSKAITLRFDRVDLSDGRNFVVGSLVHSNTPNTEDNNLGEFIAALTSAASSKQNTQSATSPINTINPQTDWDATLPALADMANDMMLLLSSRGKIIDANAPFFTTLATTHDAVNGKSFLDLVKEEDRPYIQPLFKNLFQDKGQTVHDAIGFECRVQVADSTHRWLDCRVKPYEGKLLLVCRDLTDSKRHEAELLRREQQLSEAQSIGRMGHWMWRIGDETLEFSNEIYRIFGVTPETFIPTFDNINGMMHRRDRGRMAQSFQRAMFERKTYEMEFRVMRPDGKQRFIVLQGRCEMDAEGDAVALFGIMQDVTERNEYESNLREAKESAERAYSAKSQFLANMSHELRTPLNAIIGFSEMMQRQMLGPIGTEKYLDYIGGIRESGEHLLDMITDILDMSKIEAGKYTLDVEEFNLYKVIRLASHMMEGRALDAQVKITSTIKEDDSLTILGDRRAIMQMVLNVLSNAVKFTKQGGEVAIACAILDNAMIALKITDTGIGIPASKLRYVTKPFEQAANSFTRNHDGTGLGLAITKELAELHGGKLELESTVGVGTKVTIALPLRARMTKH